jgi:hypothetical protein
LTLDQFAKLVRKTDKGWIQEDSERIVIFRVEKFQAFVDRLASIAWAKVADPAFYQMGNEIGHTAFHYSKGDASTCV